MPPLQGPPPTQAPPPSTTYGMMPQQQYTAPASSSLDDGANMGGYSTLQFSASGGSAGDPFAQVQPNDVFGAPDVPQQQQMSSNSLKEIERSATYTFCPTAPFLATGSVAGAIDLSFSTSSQLEVCSR